MLDTPDVGKYDIGVREEVEFPAFYKDKPEGKLCSSQVGIGDH